MKLTPYLMFADRCEEALLFYERCGLGRIEELKRFEGSPMQGQVRPDMAKKIMHARFAGPGVRFMASDSPRAADGGFAGFGLSLECETIAEAERLFTALADGGTVTMPLQKQFWGATFGMLTDRFGAPWMIDCPPA